MKLSEVRSRDADPYNQLMCDIKPSEWDSVSTMRHDVSTIGMQWNILSWHVRHDRRYLLGLLDEAAGLLTACDGKFSPIEAINAFLERLDKE